MPFAQQRGEFAGFTIAPVCVSIPNWQCNAIAHYGAQLNSVRMHAIYVGVMYFTEWPIEWWVLGLMALIVLPILVFRKRITSTGQEFNTMPGQEKLKVMAKTAVKIARKGAGL